MKFLSGIMKTIIARGQRHLYSCIWKGGPVEAHARHNNWLKPLAGKGESRPNNQRSTSKRMTL